MVTDKKLRFTDKNWNLNELSRQIVSLLDNNGWMTQKANTSKAIVIQARKEDILRDIITADRALTILISGQPDDFTVRVGIGKWLQNLSVAAVETVLTAGLFLVIDVPEMLWNRHVENDVINKITRLVENKQETLTPEQ
jgi:hypothetical protein